jgi:pimeloyl-ACP methyl ester carboxylesterase
MMGGIPARTNLLAPLSDWSAEAAEYWVDALQRWVLFLDVMRVRGNQYRAHMAEAAPHVLGFKAEPVVDGRLLDRPVNYCLVRIVPPEGIEIDARLRPFVVVDPRAGHGPGIGGFKSDSEIGVALRASHPCYFIGFLPEPMPGQTIEDVARAEEVFLEKVIELHPQADEKPCVIGNCQAGWAVMMLAALRPNLFGPIIVAGAPLSYWQGVHGKYPMRYSGGLSGGSWLTAFASDLGGGRFDGAWLVQNFENQNPANTYWTKQYNLYSKIDTEAPRYLGFERWWGGHVNLNAAEIQFIVDELFIGNNLAAGKIRTSGGLTVDLRSIRSPIVVLCSEGDNITPPQQALGWILDLYENVDELRARGQTIVYAIHPNVGHLGIFVSGKVARKEHDEFSTNIDLIDTLPPGLYQAMFDAKTEATVNPEMVSGDWVMRCEARTFDDIRALGGNSAADERCFATVDRVSQTNLALYRAFMQPMVRALVNPAFVDAMRHLHPLRLQYEVFSNANPAMAPVEAWAEKVRERRKPAAAGNPYSALQADISRQIAGAFDAFREFNEAAAERAFLAIYGSNALQAAAGIDPRAPLPPRRASKDLLHYELIEKRIAEVRSRCASGGVREAVIRSLLFAGMDRAAVDERGFEALSRIRRSQSDVPLSIFKKGVREQFDILSIDPEAALAAIPAMLPPNGVARQKAFELICEVLSARGWHSGEDLKRIHRIGALFDIDGPLPVSTSPAIATDFQSNEQARAS